MSRFVTKDEVPVEQFEWGSAAMRCSTPMTGCTSFVILEVVLGPGKFHAFHYHPGQDEMIIITKGKVVQHIESESKVLGVGDSVYIDGDVVHGSYNDFDEDAHLCVVLAPASGELGYVAIDVSGEEPWASLR